MTRLIIIIIIIIIYTLLFQGVAVKLLDNYVQAVKSEQKDVSQILLMCKSNLIPLYTRVGFVLRGKSDVVHGEPHGIA